MIFLVFGIFYTWTVYGKAKKKGRSPIQWAGIAAATFIGTEVFILVSFGVIYGLGENSWGWSEHWIETREIPITVFALAISIFTNWLVMCQLNKTQEEFSTAPPTKMY
jgi:hypothetical protein